MAILKTVWLAAVLLAGLLPAAALAEEPAAAPPEKGRITGVGGIFYKSKDPTALAAWYRDVLGMKLEEWGGAVLPYDAPGHPPVVVWGLFPETTDYFAPSTQAFMVNFAVDDLDAFLAKLEAKGVTAKRHDGDDPNGRFAWIMDPDGNKIELWEPSPQTPK